MWHIINVKPCTPLHEVAGVGEGVNEEEERVPQTSTGVHADEVKAPVLTNVIDHCARQNHNKMLESTIGLVTSRD